MKVLHVITSLSRGGAETALYRLLAGIDRNRFSAKVISLTSRSVVGAEIASLGYDVVALNGRNGILGPGAVRLLRKVADEYAPDLVHSWMYHANIAAHLFLRRRPLLVSVRGGTHSASQEKWLTRAVRWADAKLSSRASAVLYNSNRSSIQHQAIGYDPDRTVVIPNGFDTSQFTRRAADRHRIRAELQLADGTPVVVLVARFHPVKGHEILLDAAHALAAAAPKCIYWLVGRGCESSNEALNAMIHERKLDGQVMLLGERTDVSSLYSAADVSVCPSRSESFPNAVGEAMACETPCVVADVGDCAHLVAETGLVFPPGRALMLAACLRTILAETEVQRRERGRAARERIIEHFSLRATLDRYERLYSEVAPAAVSTGH